MTLLEYVARRFPLLLVPTAIADQLMPAPSMDDASDKNVLIGIAEAKLEEIFAGADDENEDSREMIEAQNVLYAFIKALDPSHVGGWHLPDSSRP